MPYRTSPPLTRWRQERRDVLASLAAAHAAVGGVPVEHAYVLALVAQFQGYVREFHDLVATRVVVLAGVQAPHASRMSDALRERRDLDRGNADLRTIRHDFARIGVADLPLEAHDPLWHGSPGRRGDRAEYVDLLALRNAIAHGNDSQLERLRDRGVLDSLAWARQRWDVLDRVGAALDVVAWEHVTGVYGEEPW